MATSSSSGVTTTSGQIYFTGLGSDTDFDSLVTKLVEVEQARVTTYQTWKTTWENKITAFQELNTQMLSMRTTLESMDTVNEFLSKGVTSSNADSLTATADGGAEVGTYSFSVNQLAQNAVMISKTGYSSLTQDINPTSSGASFSYTYAGTTVTSTVPATASLTDLVNIINTNSANTGVRASTLYDGSNYYLQLKGLDTGAANSLSIASNSGLAGFAQADFSVTQANQDAQIKINGWPLSNAWISRSSNTITDVVDGLSLKLASAGSGTITVDTDIDAVVENVQTFVDAFNSVRSLLYDLTKFDSTTQTASILTGNYGLQLIDSNLKSVMADQGLGFDAKRDALSSLASVGLSTDSEEGSDTFGQILIDEDALREALEKDPDAVGRIFAADHDGDTDSADVSYTSYIDGITKAGNYNVSYVVSGGSIVGATIDGHPATYSADSNTITGSSGYDESGIVLTVNNLTDGSYSHTVNLRLGKTGQLVDELDYLTDDTSGPLAILEDNYTDIADNIQDKIDRENERIATMETHLRDKYSRLDTLLGTYNSLQTTLESQIAQLSD